MDGDCVVEVDRVRHEFRERGTVTPALQGVSLSVGAGQVVGIIGPNGAGKTTLLSCMLGLVKPDSGRVRVFGRDPIAERPSIVQRVGAVMDGNRFLFPSLSLWQNMTYIGLLRNVPWRQLRQAIGAACEQLKIGDVVTRRPYTLSLGQKQRALIATATLTDPDLIVLDEPTTGLDDAGIQQITNYIRMKREQGKTVVVASHQLEWLESIADEFLLLAKGYVLWRGTLESFQPVRTRAFRLVVRGDLPKDVIVMLKRLGADIDRSVTNVVTIQLQGNSEHFVDVFRTIVNGGSVIEEFSLQGMGLRQIYRQLVEEASHRAPHPRTEMPKGRR